MFIRKIQLKCLLKIMSDNAADTVTYRDLLNTLPSSYCYQR